MIAQQILTLQRAKAAGVKMFDFEGTRLGLRPTFSIFITMVGGGPVCGRGGGQGHVSAGTFIMLQLTMGSTR